MNKNLMPNIPEKMRELIFKHHSSMHLAFVRRDWEKVGLSAGKICEVSYWICHGTLRGNYNDELVKPTDFQKACENLIKETKTNNPNDKSMRVLIPRVLSAIYHIRNDRDVGHISPSIVSNELDASLMLSMGNWVVAELVRILNDLESEDASKVVSQLSERPIQAVWSFGDEKRVLLKGLSTRDQILVLLYDNAQNTITTESLQSWTLYSNSTRFKGILSKLNREKLIIYRPSLNISHITPSGTKAAEKVIRELKAT